MPQWKKASNPQPVIAMPTAAVAQPQTNGTSIHYVVFQCEMADLQKELNQRFPDGGADVQHLQHFGSSCFVVVKVS